MSKLRDKVIFVTGGSRGIGLAMASRAARDGARLAIVATDLFVGPGVDMPPGVAARMLG